MSNADGLQRLLYLCQIKNDLNRKRRRFYYIWSDLAGLAYRPKPGVRKHKSFTVESARIGYIKAQTAMKSMTRDMRKMRVDCGVRFIWNDGGLISAIELGSGKRIEQKSFKRYYEAEIFEMELFSE